MIAKLRSNFKLLMSSDSPFLIRFLTATIVWGVPSLWLRGLHRDPENSAWTWRWPGLFGPLFGAVFFALVTPMLMNWVGKSSSDSRK